MPNTTEQESSATDVAAARAGDVASSAQESARQVADEATTQAQKLLDESRRKGRTHAHEQGERVADAARSMTSELRSMADASSGQLGGLVHQGADQIDTLVQRFDQDGLDGLSRDVRRLARQRPLAFVAGTFSLGFVLGRVLRNADTSELTDVVSDELSTDEQSGRSTSQEFSTSRESATPTTASSTTQTRGVATVPSGEVGR